GGPAPGRRRRGPQRAARSRVHADPLADPRSREPRPRERRQPGQRRKRRCDAPHHGRVARPDPLLFRGRRARRAQVHGSRGRRAPRQLARRAEPRAAPGRRRGGLPTRRDDGFRRQRDRSLDRHAHGPRDLPEPRPEAVPGAVCARSPDRERQVPRDAAARRRDRHRPGRALRVRRRRREQGRAQEGRARPDDRGVPHRPRGRHGRRPHRGRRPPGGAPGLGRRPAGLPAPGPRALPIGRAARERPDSRSAPRRGSAGRPTMNISRFFIDRPIFASVLSIVIVIVGMVSYGTLPVAQYPEVVPPTIVVNASCPGANAQVVCATVATPLEQEINGVEDMLYMSSQCTSDGSVSITITFRLGTDLDTAQVLAQNRVAIAEPRLPEEVRRIGVTTRKSSPDLLLVIHMVSPSGRYDQLYISNYALLQVRDVLARVDGVGDVTLFGARDYSMRVWLHPDRIPELGMTAGDVVAALREQNVQVAA